MCDLPRDGVLHVEQASEFARVRERWGESQLVDFEDLRLDGDAAVAYGIAAYNHKVGVKGLGDTDRGGPRGSEVNGKTEMVESVLAIIASDGEEPHRAQALVEGVWKRIADPGEIGLPGSIIEGEDEDDATAGSGGIRGWG